MNQKYLVFCFLISAVCRYEIGSAQCDNTVPIASVDISSAPTATGTTSISGSGKCCLLQANNQNCGILEIQMNENSAGFNITFNGPNQCGIDVWYDVTDVCAPLGNADSKICDPICVSGPTVELLLCKSGNFNTLSINVTGLEATTIEAKNTTDACASSLTAFGVSAPVDWSCTGTDPETGQSLLNYLDCGSGPGVNINCTNPSFNYTGPIVTDCGGKVLTYCFNSAPTTCMPNGVPIFGELTVFPEITGTSITKTCSMDGLTVTLTAETDLSCSMNYLWSTGETTQSIDVPNDCGTYDVEVSFVNQAACSVGTATQIANCFSVNCPDPSVNVNCSSGLPAAASTEAEFEALPGSPSIGGACEAFNVSSSDGPLVCSGGQLSVTRTYTITSGIDMATCDIVYVFDDTTAPTLSNQPSDITVNCSSAIPGNPGITASDNCGESISVMYSQSGSVVCGSSAVISNTWMATDCNGNAVSYTQSVTVNLTNPSASASGNDINCSNPQVTLDASSSTVSCGAISYSWSTANGNILSGEMTSMPIVDAAGTYSLTITDTETGCTDSAMVVISGNSTPPTASAVGAEITCTESSPVLDASGSSGQGVLSYSWSTANGNILSGEMTSMPIVDAVGTYTVTVTDNDNGCTSTTSAVVTEDVLAPTASAVGGEITCTESSPILNASGSSGQGVLTYSWSTSDGNILSGEMTSMPIVDAVGTYTVTVTDNDNGCSSTASAVVTEDFLLPMATAVGAEITCAESSPILDASGSSGQGILSYSWSTMNGNILSGETTATPIVNATGTYVVTVTDSDNGCTSTASAVVLEDILAPIANAIGGELTCTLTNISLDASGSSGQGILSYSWSTMNGNILSGETTATPIVNAAATYVVTVTDSDNGCTSTASAVVLEDILAPIANAIGGELTCSLTNVSLDAGGSSGQGMLTYSWGTADGNILSGEMTSMPLVDATGTYTVTVTDNDNGCTSTASAVVTEDKMIPSASATGGVLDCTTMSINLDASGSSGQGSLSYMWTTSDGNIVSGENTSMPAVNAIGSYVVTVTDGDNGCISTASVIVTEDIAAPNPSITGSELSCGSLSVILDASGSSGQGTLSFSWSTTDGNIIGGETTDMLEVDETGTYVLTVTDSANSCTSSASYTVTEDTTVPDAIISGEQIDCDTPVAILDGSGSTGLGSLNYMWSTINGNIVSGESNSIATVDAPGDYMLLVTDTNNSCSSASNYTVVESLSQPTVFLTNDELSCLNTSTIIDASGSSGIGSLSFNWSSSDGNIVSGALTSMPLVDAPGTYTVTVTDSNNSCTSTSSAVVTEDILAPTADALGGELTCAVTIISLDASGSNGQGSLDFSWGSGDGNIISGFSTSMPLVDATGTYTVTVTDNDNGCTSTASAVVTEDVLVPTADALGGELTCAEPDIILDASGSSGQGVLLYTWSSTDGNILADDMTAFPVVDAVGTYTVTVMDNDNGCTSTASAVVAEDVLAPTADAVGGELTCAEPDIILDVSGSSGQGVLLYMWSSADGNILADDMTAFPVVDAVGTYTVTVTDNDNGCTSTASAVVTEDVLAPTADALGGELTCAEPDIILDASGSSGQGVLLYSWSSTDGNILADNMTAFPVVDAVGTYTVTVTDNDNGCTSTASAVVTEDILAPMADAEGGELTCATTSINLNASGSSGQGVLLYGWSTTDGNIVADDFTAMPIIDAVGTYTVTVTDNDNGCTSTASTIVTEDILTPMADAVGGELTCAITNINLDASGSSGQSSLLYNWNSVDGNIVNGGNTGTPLIDAVGTYTVTVTDNDNGCTSTASAIVTEDNIAPTAEAIGGELTCSATNISLNASGSSGQGIITYSWGTIDGNISAGVTTAMPVIDAIGTYTVTVTDSDNGCSSTASSVVTEDNIAPTADAVGGELTCSASSISLDASGSIGQGALSYNWSTFDGNIVSGVTTAMPVIDAIGTYMVTVTDSDNGCSSTSSVLVNEDLLEPTANALGGELTCEQTNISLDGSISSGQGFLTYNWSSGDGNIVSGSMTAIPIVDATGTYVLTITDSDNGCTATVNIIVPEDILPPTADAMGGELTCTLTSISLDASGSSGQGSLSYSWSTTNGNIVNGAMSAMPIVDLAGNYSVTVTDSDNGCTSTTETVVTENIQAPLSLIDGGELTCANPDIVIDASGSSGQGTLSYVWGTGDGNIVNGGMSAMPVINSTGTYTVTVTDSNNGCTSIASTLVTEDLVAPAADAVGGELTCDVVDLNLNGLGSSGQAILSYAWSTSDGNIVSGTLSSKPLIDTPGNYTLTITDSDNGCTDSATTVVTEDVLPPLVSVTGDELTCTKSSISLDASGSTGQGSISYAWSSGDGSIVSGAMSNMPEINAIGTYSVTVTDSDNACTSIGSISVSQDINSPMANAIGGELTCAATSTLIDASGSSGQGSLSYNWSTADGNIVSDGMSSIPLVDATGTYTVTVTDSDNGCTSTAIALIDEDVLSPTADALGGVLNCVTMSFNLDASGSTGQGNLNYNWSTADGNIVSGSNTSMPQVNDIGTYLVTVTDSDNGCSDTAMADVTQDIEAPITLTTGGELSCGTTSIMLDGSKSSGQGILSYEWSTTDGNIVTGDMTPMPTVNETGTYTLTVTDSANGCSSTSTSVVTEDVTIPIAAINGSQINCSNASVILDGSTSSGQGILSFLWTTANGNVLSGETSSMATVDAVGEYVLTVTDNDNGCSSTALYQVTDNFLPPVSTAIGGELTCGVTSINIDASSSSGQGTLSYVWDTVDGNIINGGFTDRPLVNASGSYSVTVTDAFNGCTSETSVLVDEDINLPLANIIGGELTCETTSRMLNAGSSSGQGLLSYTWSTSDGNIVSGELTPTPIINLIGNYSVTVTDSDNACTDVASVVVNEDVLQPIASALGGELNCAVEDVVLNATASTGQSMLKYHWGTTDGNILSGANTVIPVADAPGSYKVTVTDSDNGCTNTTTVNVTEDFMSPNAVGVGGTLTCANPSIEITAMGSSGQGALTYSWNTTDGNIESGALSFMPIVNSMGTYSLTVTDEDNGCTDETTVIVDQNIQVPVSTPVGGELNCSQPSISLDASSSSGQGTLTYAWNTTDGNIESGAFTSKPIVNQAGTYIVTVTDGFNGCSSVNSTLVTEDILVPSAIALDAEITCSETSVLLDASNSSGQGTLSYAWNTTNGNILSNSLSSNPLVNAVGSYTVTVTDNDNGCTSMASAIVTEDNIAPTAEAIGGELTCSTSAISLDANGSSGQASLSYSWGTSDGNIISGAMTAMPVVNTVGTYTVTVSDSDNGCTAMASTFVSEDLASPIASAIGAELTCSATSVSLNASASSGQGTLSYNWSTTDGNIISGAMTAMPVVNMVGSYMLVVTDVDNGCSSSTSVAVTQDVSDPIVSVTGGELTCSNQFVKIDGSASVGQGVIIYDWTTLDGNITNGAATSMPVVDAVGTYTLVITDSDNGCTAETSIIVSEDIMAPTAVAVGDELTCAFSSVILNASNSSGQGTLSYSWSTADGNIVSSSMTAFPVVDAVGTYTLTVMDSDNGCTDETSVVVTEDILAPVAVAMGRELTCTANSIGLDASASTGQGTLSYAWSTTDGNIESGSTTATPVVNAVGTYSVTVTDADNGCTDETSVVVTEDNLAPVAVATGGELTCTANSIGLDASASTGQGTLSYIWSTTDGNIVGGSTTAIPVVDAVGTYSVTVTDGDNGCTSAISVVVTQDIITPTANAVGGELTCVNPSITLDGGSSSGQGALSYSWSTPDGNILNGAATITPVVDNVGTYILVVTDGNNGCTDEFSVNVTQDYAAPTANATGGEITCASPIISLDGSTSAGQGTLSYAWSTMDGNILSGALSSAPVVDKSGIYTLIVTDSDNGCTSSTTVIVTEDFVMPAVIAEGGTLTCAATSIALDASASTGQGALSYVWNTLDGNIINGAPSAMPIIDAVGTYSVTVTDSDNGCTSESSVLVDEDLLTPVASGFGDELSCNQIDVTLDGSTSFGQSALSYLWSTMDGNIVSGQTSAMPVADAPGTYKLIVTDSDNGCTDEVNVVVSQDIVSPLAVASGNELNCDATARVLDGTASIGQGALAYNWSTNDGNILSGNLTSSPLIDEPGTYILIVTDSDNGCMASSSYTVIEDVLLPTVNITGGELTCTTTSLILDASGSIGQSTLNYKWETNNGNIVSGSTTSMPIVDLAGLYSLTITDSDNGCISSGNIELTEDLAPPTANALGGVLDCVVMSLDLDGSTSSGQGTLLYNWSTNDGNIVSGSTTAAPTVNLVGTYGLTVTDNDNGCTDETSVEVTEDMDAPNPDITGSELSCGVISVSLDASGSSGQGMLNFSWTTIDGNIISGENTDMPVVDEPGTYTVTVTDDSNSCTSSANYTVTADVTVPVAMVTGEQLDCDTALATLDGSASSGQGTLSFSWSTSNGNIASGMNMSVAKVDAPGDYTLIVTDTNNSCSSSKSYTVVENFISPIINMSASELNCSVTNLSIDASASTGQGTLSYNWETIDGNIVSGALTSMPNIDQPGTYMLTITDSNNACSATGSLEITEDVLIPSISINGGELNCSVTSLNLDGSASAGQGALSFSWSTINGNVISGVATSRALINSPGTYSLIITDSDNGCTNSEDIIVSQDVMPPIAEAIGGELNCIVDDVELGANGSSGQGTLNYAWSTFDGNIMSGSLSAFPVVGQIGTYTVTVTDNNNGCTATSSATVTQDVIEPIAAGIGGTLTCVNPSIEITATGSNGQGTLTYNWGTFDGNIQSSGTTFMPIVNAQGTYTVTVTDTNNGCTSSTSVSVDQNVMVPSASAIGGELTCSNTFLALDASNSSGQGTLGYAWTTVDGNIVSGENSVAPIIDVPGAYMLIVTDGANGCTTAANTTVSEDVDSPTAIAIGGEINCGITSIQLDASASTGQGILSYHWDTIDGNILSGVSSDKPLVNAIGMYTVTVTDSDNGCTSSTSVTVTEDLNKPTAVASGSELNCATTNIPLSASGSSGQGNLSYSWSTVDGNIVSGALTVGPVVNAPGTYFVIVTDSDNGCTDTDSYTVAEDVMTPVAIAQGGELNCAATSIVLDASGSNGQAGLTYSWSTAEGNIISGSATAYPVINATGTYVLTVTDSDNGCSSIDELVITEDILEPSVMIQGGELSCAINKLYLDASASSGQSALIFQWSTVGGNVISGSTTNSPLVDESGTYQLIITDSDNGCTAIGSIEVTQDINQPTAVATGGELTCAVTSIQIDGSSSTGQGNLLFSWTTINGNILNGSNTAMPTVNEPGEYTLLVTDESNGCTDIATITVTQDVQAPIATATGGEINCSNSQIQIDGSGSAGQGILNYMWTTPNGNIVSGSDTAMPVVDASGVYYLEITDTDNGCVAFASALVTQDFQSPTAGATATELSCAETISTLDGTSSSGQSSLSYMWTTAAGNITNGSMSSIATADLPGVYTLIVTDSDNGCTDEINILIDQDIISPNALALGGELSCNNPTIELDASSSTAQGSLSYSWSTLTGNIITNGNTASPLVDMPGTYTVTVTDSDNGCTDTDTAIVTEDVDIPLAQATGGELTCAIASIQLDASGSTGQGSLSYSWSSMDGNIVNGVDLVIPTVDAPGTYIVTVTDSDNGCSNTAAVIVTEDIENPLAQATGGELTCVNTSIQLDASGSTGQGSLSYSWSTDDGSIVSEAQSSMPIVDAPGTYTVTVTDSDNGCTDTEQLEVTQDILSPQADAVGGELTCAITSIQLDASGSTGQGSLSYSWSTNDGNIVSEAQSSMPTVDAPGTYTVTVTDSDNGCTDTEQLEVTQDILSPQADAVGGELTCAITSIQLDAGGSTGQGSLSYSWSTDDGNIVNGEGTTMPVVNAPGTYTVTVTDSDNGCTNTNQVIVDEDVQAPEALATGGELNCDVSMLILDGSGSTGQGSLGYNWSTSDGNIVSGGMSSFPEVDAPGTYIVNVTDSDNDCSSTSSAVVTEDVDMPELYLSSSGILTCGITSITITAESSSANIDADYEYAWSTGQTSQTIDVMMPGNYSVSVTDTDNGCMVSGSIYVDQNIVEPLADAGSDIIICGQSPIFLDASNSSGQGALTYYWSTSNGQIISGQNSSMVEVGSTGSYSLIVEDGLNSCTSTDIVNVELTPIPELIVSECFCIYDPVLGQVSSSVSVSVRGGTPPYMLASDVGYFTEDIVSEGQVVELFLGQSGGTYNIDVVDSNSCTNLASGNCEPCGFDPAMITDPCSCNDDQSYNGSGDGTFGERVEINGPAGLNLIIGTGSNGIIGKNIGDPIPEISPGYYRLLFDHQNKVGFELFVEGISGNSTFPILDQNGNQLYVSNICLYPIITEPVLDIIDFCNNSEPLVFTGNEVEEINGFDGIVEVFVGNTAGTPITEFDPSQYANGYYTLTFLFTGNFVNNVSNGIDPAFPGCQTQTSILVGVGGGGSLTCNDNVNMTVNANCELDFSWNTLLESDAIPNVFEPRFYSPEGNEVLENELGSFIGSYVEYAIFDECNGNSCWGTIHIEDKTDPVIDCDVCPPIGGTDASQYDPDCVLNCYDLPILQLRYDDGLRDDLIQEDYEDFLDDAMTDNCDNWNEEDVSFYDQYTSLGTCNGTRLQRTWTVGYTKANGTRGTVSCTREYFFKPLDLFAFQQYPLDANGNPIFSQIEDAIVLPPKQVELPCGVDVSPAGIAAFFDDPTTEDRDTDNNGIDPDELDIDLVIENHEGFRWAYPHFYQEGDGSGSPFAQKIDNEICNIISGYTDNEIDACAPGCDGNRKVLRDWVLLDWCSGSFINYSQIIKSIDQSPPVLTVLDVIVSVDPWNCEATVRLPRPEHISDDCDPNISYAIGNRGGLSLSGNTFDGFVLHNVPLGTHTIEYTSTDCCGNVGRTTMTVTVVDNTPPVAVSKEFIVLSLTNVGNPVDQFQGTAKLYAEDVDNGSYDGCSDVTLSVRRTPVCNASDAEWGPFVKFCCEDLENGTQANIDVELRIVDANGNANIVWATVLLEDKSATIPQAPPHMYLTCDMDYNNFEMTGGIPRFFGACGEAMVECDTLEVIENTEPRELRASDGVFIDGFGPITAPAYDPSCGTGAIRREFRDCGGGFQWFVIEPIDPFDPSTITWPDDVVVDCNDYETGEPSWEEATCNLVGVSLRADTFLFEDDACYKILNHWTVINWCVYDPSNPSQGGRYVHTQTIKIIDTVDPVLTVTDSLCFAVTVDCVSSDLSLSGSATDDGECGSEWISWDVSIDAYADWTEDFHYATTEPPFLPSGEVNPYHIPKTGNGEEATITLPDGIPSSKIWHRAVWRAFDGCGNTASVTRYFQIVDKKAPTPYCLNLSTAVMSNGQVELWAIDFNVDSFDNCTDSDNLLFTFTDTPPPARDDTEYDSNDDLMWYNGTFWYYDSETGDYESQDDYGDDVHRWEPGLRSAGKVFTTADADASGFAQVPIYVWDECGNIDFCLVNLRLVDNGGGGMAMVAGQVKTEFGQEVEQVVTEMDGPLNFRETDLTDAQGEYAFTNTPFYADYQVRGEKNDDYLNGVSTLDLIMIQRHIIGQETLDSPYKMIAADANNDGEISALDLIELRKLILGIYDELPDNGSWKFINADNSLDVDNAWNYTETRSIEDLAFDKMDEDFVGVKIGDVNGTAIANARMEGEPVSQTAPALNIGFEDRVLGEGELVEIVLNTEREDLYGYQFTLSTPGLELVDVKGIAAEHVAAFDQKVTVSYNKTERLQTGTLVTFVMKAQSAGQLSELLEIGSELTHAEAYVGNALEIVTIDIGESGETGEFALYQNEPNPFTDYTVIGFELPEEGSVSLRFHDVTGRHLTTIQGIYPKGFSSIKINKDELNHTGLIYYSLKIGDNILTKYMIHVN